MWKETNGDDVYVYVYVYDCAPLCLWGLGSCTKVSQSQSFKLLPMMIDGPINLHPYSQKIKASNIQRIDRDSDSCIWVCVRN